MAETRCGGDSECASGAGLPGAGWGTCSLSVGDKHKERETAVAAPLGPGCCNFQLSQTREVRGQVRTWWALHRAQGETWGLAQV